EGEMKSSLTIAGVVVAAAAIFGAGVAVGQNKFGQPKTVVQVSMIKWKKDVPDAAKQKAIDGVKEMAAQIPGIKNVWLKADRVQPRDYDAGIAIEFESRDAANAYAENPIHEKWSKAYLEIREASISPQFTNP